MTATLLATAVRGHEFDSRTGHGQLFIPKASVEWRLFHFVGVGRTGQQDFICPSACHMLSLQVGNKSGREVRLPGGGDWRVNLVSSVNPEDIWCQVFFRLVCIRAQG